jgi:hypothetical protein
MSRDRRASWWYGCATGPSFAEVTPMDRPSMRDDPALNEIIKTQTDIYVARLESLLPESVDHLASALVSVAVKLMRSGMSRTEVDLLTDVATDIVHGASDRRPVLLQHGTAAAERLDGMEPAGSA